MRRTSMTRAPAQSRAPVRYGAALWARKLAAVVLILGVWVESAAAEVRLLAFGDSLVQGYGLPAEEGFVPQLSAWLAANGASDVDVINGGVSGDTTAGGLARISWALSETPDAVIVELGANDMLRGLPLDELRSNLDGILSIIAAENLPVLLVSVPSIANYGPDYEAEYREIYADLADTYGALFYPNFFAGITEGRTLQEAQALMQPDGIHPNADGVRANVELIGPSVLELVTRARS
ncbi:MAG: arylesterase [Pseudomonadota bacterium]